MLLTPNMSIRLLVFVCVLGIHVSALQLPRHEYSGAYESDLSETPQKRPFCNAFTGCGKKRSDTPTTKQILLGNRRASDDDIVKKILEQAAEPIAENLSRQIISEAALWEALQAMSTDRRTIKDGFEGLPLQ